MPPKKKSQEPKTSRYVIKLAERLFSDETRRLDFLQSLQNPSPASPALIWLQAPPETADFLRLERPSIFPEFIDLLEPGSRPGKSRLHEEGFYYIFDPASVLMALPAYQLRGQIRTVLDMCASPGGKSVFLQAALSPHQMVSNEVVKNRLPPLIANLKRCKVPSSVTQKDPSTFAKEMTDQFDLVFVDAPCSGQSLVAKGESAPGCFHPSAVNGCRLRQRRVVAESLSAVKPGGYLVYSTCTYSREENEDIVDWLLERTPGLETVEVPSLAPWRSDLSPHQSYRFLPDKIYGAGGFTCLFKKAGLLESDGRLDLPQDWILWRPQL